MKRPAEILVAIEADIVRGGKTISPNASNGVVVSRVIGGYNQNRFDLPITDVSAQEKVYAKDSHPQRTFLRADDRTNKDRKAMFHRRNQRAADGPIRLQRVMN